MRKGGGKIFFPRLFYLIWAGRSNWLIRLLLVVLLSLAVVAQQVDPNIKFCSGLTASSSQSINQIISFVLLILERQKFIWRFYGLLCVFVQLVPSFIAHCVHSYSRARGIFSFWGLEENRACLILGCSCTYIEFKISSFFSCKIYFLEFQTVSKSKEQHCEMITERLSSKPTKYLWLDDVISRPKWTLICWTTSILLLNPSWSPAYVPERTG